MQSLNYRRCPLGRRRPFPTLPACMTPRPLIVRLRNWVGDVILGVPALHLLQSHGYQPVLVGKGWARPLLAGEGWPTHARPGPLRERVAQLRALRRDARALDAGFDRRENALVLATSFSGALEMRLAGLKAVGYAQEARGLLLKRAEPITYGGHALTSYWELACRFLRMDLPPPERIQLKTLAADQAAADALLAQHGIRPGFVVICPFAGGLFEKQDKTWPVFAEFTKVLRTLGRDVVACPGPGEDHIISSGHPGAISLPGVTLGIYGGLLRRAALVISNDTGPAHLAAAVDTPVLSVLGPTKPEQWAPWGPQVQVLRHWPRWPTVNEAMACTEALLGGAAAPG
jgi:ADP-heptose:LPS heptosyltransferase